MRQPNPSCAADGWRQRKRKQTRQRIAETGLRLFLEQGFEATTLEAIAETVGIARRTFFHYFESKEALLFAYEDAAEEGFRTALFASNTTLSPFDAMCAGLVGMVASFDTEHARTIDRLMRSTDALRARKQGNYEKLEQSVFTALCERWPDPAMHLRLSVVAMIGVGAMRLAADAWSTDNGAQPLPHYLTERFAVIRDGTLI